MKAALHLRVLVAAFCVIAGALPSAATLLRAETLKENSWQAGEGLISGLAISPDGERLATVGGDLLQVWSFPEGKKLPTTAVDKQSGGLTAVAWSKDGKQLVVGCWNGGVRVLDAYSGSVVRAWRGHSENITSLTISSQGERIVSGSGDDTLKVWDANSGKELLNLDHANEYDINCVAFSPDGCLLVSGDGDNGLMLWNAATGDQFASLFGHEGAVTAVAFTADGKSMVSGSFDDTLIVWDVAREVPRQVLRAHQDDITALAIESKAKWMASGDEAGRMILWNLVSGKLIDSWERKAGPITSVAFSPDGRLLVSAAQGEVEIRRLK